MKDKKILILSHAFNMDGRAASQTITDKIPYLITSGITPIILSATTGSKDSDIEHHQLFPAGPAGLKFDLRHYLKSRVQPKKLYKLLMLFISIILLPFIFLEKLALGLQSQWSWSITAYIYAVRLIKKNNIKLIYSTGGAYSAHICAYWLKKTCSITWICEIHDPLISPTATRLSRDHVFQKKLEAKIARHADLIWWFTQGALISALNRHPEIKNKSCQIIPGVEQPKHRANYGRTNKFITAHFGSLSKTRSLDKFLQGVKLIADRNQSFKEDFQLHVYGSNLDQDSLNQANHLNLKDHIFCKGRIEYDHINQISGRDQVLLKMQLADCLLLLHGETADCSEYIPSKIYEYFWANRPIFGLTYSNNELNEMILSRNGFIAKSDEPTSISITLETIYTMWKNGGIDQYNKFDPIDVSQSVKKIIHECTIRNLL